MRQDSPEPPANPSPGRQGRLGGRPSRPFLVERITGTAAQLVERPLAPVRTLALCTVTEPAVVLGSTQPDVASSASVPLVRRRTGGGAVWVGPDELVWADVDIPRDDPLWDDDVARASWWLGAAWAVVVGAGADVHRHGLVRTAWSGSVCFAGLGPGEVTVGGRKVVGLSQRRTRDGARFATAALLRWDPAPLVGALGLDPAVAVELADVAAPVPGVADADEVAGRLVAALEGC